MTTQRRVVVEAARKRPPPQVQRFRVLIEHDADPDVSYLEQDEFEDRLAAYKRGEFGFVGVRVEAEVVIEGMIQTLTSPGLWGIESDSDKEYIAQVAGEEYAALRDVLKAVGVSTSQLPREVEQDWFEWRA
jgi:hypothetical protein